MPRGGMTAPLVSALDDFTGGVTNAYEDALSRAGAALATGSSEGGTMLRASQNFGWLRSIGKYAKRGLPVVAGALTANDAISEHGWIEGGVRGGLRIMGAAIGSTTAATGCVATGYGALVAGVCAMAGGAAGDKVADVAGDVIFEQPPIISIIPGPFGV